MRGLSDIADAIGMTAVRRDDGFTLVELLVVMLVLGVLAAVAVPTFLGQREKAYRTTVVSDAKSLMTAEASRLIDETDYTEDVALLASDGFKQSQGVDLPLIKVVGSTYTACVKHRALEEWLVVDGRTHDTSWAADGSSCA